MITEINRLDYPEIRNYHREVIDGAVIVRYEVRGPGEANWKPVRIVRLT